MFIEKYLINKINNFINNKETNNNIEPYIVEHFDYNKYIYPLVWFIINCAAVWLSWSCKSNENLNIGFRIVYAAFAYFFGIFYIIANYLFFSNCHKK